MKKFRYIIATLFVVAIGAGIFFACQKDAVNSNSSVSTESNKIQKDNPIVNPFDFAGIVHNACMDTILYHPDVLTMSDSERFNIVQFCLSSRLQNDYVQISRTNYQDNTDDAWFHVNNHNSSQIIFSLGENEKLDVDFSSQLITRNNYTILYELYSNLDNYTCNSENDLSYICNMISDYEQEILSNYYSLIDNGIIVSETQALYAEYKTTLMCMSVCHNSAIWWLANSSYLDNIIDNLSWDEKFKLQCEDFEAATNAWEADALGGQTLHEYGTESSNYMMAGRIHW